MLIFRQKEFASRKQEIEFLRNLGNGEVSGEAIKKLDEIRARKLKKLLEIRKESHKLYDSGKTKEVWENTNHRKWNKRNKFNEMAQAQRLAIAKSEKEAIEKIEKEGKDAILTDIDNPIYRRNMFFNKNGKINYNSETTRKSHVIDSKKGAIDEKTYEELRKLGTIKRKK